MFLFLSLVRIEYENYYMAQSSAKVVSPSSNVNITGPVAGTFVHSKDTNIVQPSVGTPKSLNRRPPMQLPNIPHQESLDESMYSSVDQKQQPIKQNEAKFYRAAFDYDAQGDQEISFKAGDHIKLIYHEDDTWWCGEVQGKRGMFPKDFVEEINP